MSSSVLEARARVAGLHRNKAPDPAVIADAKRDLRAAKLEQYIARVVAEAPPLTPEQLDRVAVLLRGGGR